jgi:hypothetical protein
MKRPALRLAIVILVAIFAGASMIGIVRSYSRIPEGDDWLGYLGFYADLLDGKYSAWFTQFNGHRPVLPRILYWLDIRYFGGRLVFLITANLVILCGIIAILIAYLRRLTVDLSTQIALGATICITGVSWLQFTNLTIGFDGAQWFTAVLLPLTAFYCLARAQEQPHFFWFALIAGVASAWTMANGVIVMPALTLLALGIRLKSAHVAILAVAGILTIGVYFNLGSGEHRPVIQIYLARLAGNPAAAVQFALGFLGNPIFCIVAYPLALAQYVFLLMTGVGPVSRPSDGSMLDDYQTAFLIGLHVSQIAGAAFIAAALMIGRRWLASEREPVRGALLAFLFFMIATAVACAAARLQVFGVGGSAQRQFTTAGMFAWTALILLGAPSISARGALAILACVTLVLLPSQMLPIFGLRGVAAEHQAMEQALQAIFRGADDPAILKALGADPDVLRRLRGTKVSIFADAP